MSRVVRRVNFRVEIDPRRPGDLGMASVPDRWFADSPEKVERHYAEECERLLGEVRRHVSGYASASVRWDHQGECSHCGWQWTEGEGSPHNGGCCDEDAKAMPVEAAS